MRSINLYNYGSRRRDLMAIVEPKIIGRKFSDLNKRFSNDLVEQIDSIEHLLNAIEAKFRGCEIIYYSYFESLHHGILAGRFDPRDLPLNIEVEFAESTSRQQVNLAFDLLDKRKAITEIAFELGYSSLQHFSAAFRKKFGVLPSKVT